MLLSAIAFTLVRCKLKSDNYIKTVVELNIDSWVLPDEATVSSPFNLILHASTENTCYSGIQFAIEENDGKKYVYAQSVFENSGEVCPPLTVYKDSTISITLSQAGKTYYYFLNENKWKKDSIIINPL